MKRRMDVPNVVSELVKNSIDAQCTIIRVEFNETFDLRVIDDGCGFSEALLQDIGESQVPILNKSQHRKFRYGKSGKFLHTITQVADEVYIETIERNSNIRFYKSINFHKSEHNVFKSTRESADATVKTVQGSSVVLNHLIFRDQNEPLSTKMDIIKEINELALINFEVKMSVKDTSSQKILYEISGKTTLFEKFEQFLELNQFFSKMNFVSCQKDNIKVELFLCDQGTPTKAFQFVYLNKLIESDGLWTKVINDLCGKKFEKDLNSKFAVYLADIHVLNHLDSQEAKNMIIENCIKKCIDQLLRTTSESKRLPKRNSHEVMEIRNEADPAYEHQTNQNEHNAHGVRLGDWIFNNSSEDYVMFDRDRLKYRNKICENWVISLDKPKAKDPHDSLAELENIPYDDDVFKKPQRPIHRNKSKNQKKIAEIEPMQLMMNAYAPSQRKVEFNSSTLMRASKQLISNRKKNFRISNSMQGMESEQNVKSSTATFKPPESTMDRQIKNSFEEELLLSSQALRKENMPTSPLLDILPGNLNDISVGRVNTAFDPPIHTITNDDNHRGDHFEIYRSTKETFGFQFSKSNFNVTYSSSVAIHTMDDPFGGFFENDISDIQSIGHLFEENSQSKPNTPSSSPQPKVNRCYESSSTQTTSQVRCHQHRRRSNSVQHYRRTETHRSFIRGSSVSSCNRSEINSKITRSHRSNRGSSKSQTTVTALSKTPSMGLINDGIRQSGWPVTINFNFGLSK